MQVYKQLNNGIKIVEYEPHFAQGICEMWANSNDDWGGDSGIDTPQQVMDEHAGSSNFNVFLALDGDKVVGYCSFARYYYDANTAYIPLLNVRSDYQGKGIGKALVLLCVERTIELGYPRIDLYTWAGNTAAVPLYKKCGYLWEDRPDSTHLTNFIPTVLKLFPEFFAKANWYTDSTRVIDIKPDGEKVNEFECFGYSWAKDNETLAIGFERSGKRIRMVETQDYKIEFIAENHKVAFGLSYDCTFHVENKTGKPLKVKISGRNEENIAFDYQLDIEAAPGKHQYPSRFYVGEITEPQDVWRVHPCLRADVEIGGKTIPFGLGIETSFPLTVELHDECKVSQIGMMSDCYINIASNLSQDATVQFTLSANPLADFAVKTHSVQVAARGKDSIKIPTTTLGVGYHPLKVTYNITQKDGTSLSFTKSLHIINHGLSQAFYFEKDTNWGITNGPWYIMLDRQDNEMRLYHIMKHLGRDLDFDPPKLGKPYDDEFNLIKPVVRTHQDGPEMVMEVEHISGKFPGLVVIQKITLTSSGIITRSYRIENRGTIARNVMLSNPMLVPLGYNTYFCYKGKITAPMKDLSADGIPDSFDDIDPDAFSENWMFEADPCLPRGICWPLGSKPALKWGDYMTFEVDAGMMEPGQVFETEPFIAVYGIFNTANDFRNYARQIYNRKPLEMEYPQEVKLNNNNPFIANRETTFELINNRSTVLEGEIRVDSLDGMFASQCQVNEEEGEATEGNTFELSLSDTHDGIGLASLSLDLALYQKTYNRALFFPSGEITNSMEGDAYVVSNGRITFKASPVYANALFSLATTGKDGTTYEWLDSRYPNHEPYAWWNPYIGGIQVYPSEMNPMTAIKENVTAGFVELPDNYGNKWSGICTTMTVSEFDELKGAIYETYYLTLPGLPLMCSFFKFINKTGVFKESTETTTAYLRIADELTDVYIDCINRENRHHRQRAGAAWQNADFVNVVKMSSTRPESFYVFHGSKLHPCKSSVKMDNKSIGAGAEHHIGVAHGETFISQPTFYLITERDLPEGTLDDLERIRFTE